MEIQWSLVLFTALTGLSGWMFVCVAADEFMSRAKTAALPAAVVALIVAVVGGLASVTHLSHPDRIMGALGHPTSGIFTEAVLVGIFCLLVIIYIVMVVRDVSGGARKVVAVAAAAVGVVLSFMAGESYLMSARPNWNTQLLPLGYMLTAIPSGIAAYLVVVALKAKEADIALWARGLLIGGVLAAVGALVYTLTTGAVDGTVAALLAVAVIGAGIVPIACGVMLPKKRESLMMFAASSCACALVGAIAYRCIMWVVTVPIADLFGVL